MTLIKTCGMFRPQDIDAVNAARPDFCGFIVDFPASHRSVTPERLRTLRAKLDDGITPVGVFVDAPVEAIAALHGQDLIDIVQLHGHEDEDYIAELRASSAAPIIKAFKVRVRADIDAACASSADMVLLDNGYGTGETFDWELMGTISRPFILAGGLTPDNIPDAIDRFHPFAVDISSGIETDRLKDPDKIERAVAAVRTTDNASDKKNTPTRKECE